MPWNEHTFDNLQMQQVVVICCAKPSQTHIFITQRL